jgi:hypothetical protein
MRSGVLAERKGEAVEVLGRGQTLGDIVQIGVRRRGFFGWLFLLIFFGFNLLMFLWLWNYWELLSIGNQPTSNAGRSGAAIGAALGTGAILFVWLVGAVVTGLFAILTRGKRVYIQTPSVVSLPAKRLSGWRRVAAVLVIGVIGFVLYKRIPSEDPKSTVNLVTEAPLPAPAVSLPNGDQQAAPVPLNNTHSADPKAIKERVKASLELTDYKWSKSEFGIMTASFTFNNRSDYDVKDIEVRCEHSAPSGTTIDSNTRTIYEVFKARSVRTISNFQMGFIHSQSARSGCIIKSFVLGEYRSPPKASSPPQAKGSPPPQAKNKVAGAGP